MIIVQCILKELSVRRILTYAQIEARLEAFEYGQNDQSNKPPTVRPKHLTNNHIAGSASQKLLLFQMLPIIFNDVINRLTDLLPIYIYVFVRLFRLFLQPKSGNRGFLI
jgi:hypothetical protein